MTYPEITIPQTVLRFSPRLALEIGEKQTLALLQICFLCQAAREDKRMNNFQENHWWTYQSYRDLHEKWFVWWGLATVHRIFSGLEDNNYLIAGNYNKRKNDKTVWWRPNYKKLAELPGIIVENYTQPEPLVDKEGCPEAGQGCSILEQGVPNLDGSVPKWNDVTKDSQRLPEKKEDFSFSEEDQTFIDELENQEPPDQPDNGKTRIDPASVLSASAKRNEENSKPVETDTFFNSLLRNNKPDWAAKYKELYNEKLAIWQDKKDFTFDMSRLAILFEAISGCEPWLDGDDKEIFIWRKAIKTHVDQFGSTDLVARLYFRSWLIYEEEESTMAVNSPASIKPLMKRAAKEVKEKDQPTKFTVGDE